MSATSSTARNYGPSALGDDLRRFVSLTIMLATTDFKLRYFGSVLGYAWSLARPLMFFGVLYVFFTNAIKLGDDVPHYPVYLLTSIVLWTFFIETTGGCVQSLTAREALLRKMRFPRLVIPVSVGLTALFNLGMNLLAVLAFALATGVAPRWSWLELLPLILLLAAMALGIGMLLSALYVRFRDIEPIWDVTSQILFYGSPIIYVAATYDTARAGLAELAVMLNPIAAILTQVGHAFVDERLPSAGAVAGSVGRLALPLVVILAISALGLWFFSREAPRIAENL